MHITLLSLTSSEACSGERVPVLACRDALRAGGAEVNTVSAGSDGDIDTVIESVGQDAVGERRLVIAATADGEVRAVLRRMVRRYAPPPSRRPDDLPADRTVYDLPSVGVLPLDFRTPPDLVIQLGLPRSPEDVARAVLRGTTRRLDLFRTDSGSVTVNGSLVGGADQQGQATAWYGQVEVDDAILTDGTEPLIACAIANTAGYAAVDGLPLVVDASPEDGMIDVGVAVPVVRRGLFRRKVRIEVRRSRGRAVSITPRVDVPFLDDGVAGTLGRKRSWWIERAAWSVYFD